MSRIAIVVLQQFAWKRTQDLIEVPVVELHRVQDEHHQFQVMVSREQGLAGDHLRQDAASRPEVDGLGVVGGLENQLR